MTERTATEAESSAETGRTPRKATRKRAEETRERLMEAATELFPALGFDGVSARTIETHAGVQRGLIAYHFDTKEALWREMADRLFADLGKRLSSTAEAIRDLAPEERQKAFITTFVRYSADAPMLNRMMAQEGKAPSWRLDYLYDTHLCDIREEVSRIIGREIDAHSYYVMTGAGAFVFTVEHVCEKIFGVNPREEAFVDEHARIVAGLLDSLRRETDER